MLQNIFLFFVIFISYNAVPGHDTTGLGFKFPCSVLRWKGKLKNMFVWCSEF